MFGEILCYLNVWWNISDVMGKKVELIFQSKPIDQDLANKFFNKLFGFVFNVLHFDISFYSPSAALCTNLSFYIT